MRIGLTGNTGKNKFNKLARWIISRIDDAGLHYYLDNSFRELEGMDNESLTDDKFLNTKELCQKSDVLFSIGGDGTMLTTAYYAQSYDTPVLGVNFGKLGFLAEVEIQHVSKLLDDLKNQRFSIEERPVLFGVYNKKDSDVLYAINDFVIDKGGWPKMIEMTIKADGEYVTTFSGDGVIIATPTGSTGYSLSAGGSIVVPGSDVMSLSPISPHSLTMRPLVLPLSVTIEVIVEEHPTEVQVNSDGQRVNKYVPPFALKIRKSKRALKVLRTRSVNYFEILRSKLLWGLDLRNHARKKNDESSFFE